MPYKDPAAQREYNKKKYLKNREKILQRSKERYQANLEENREWHRKYAKENRERINIYRKKWRKKLSAEQKEKYQKYEKIYRRKHPERLLERNRRYYNKHKIKVQAHRILGFAVRYGFIKRPDTCSHCNKPCHPQAHHTDYSKPVEVVWLCKACHAIEHSS